MVKLKKFVAFVLLGYMAQSGAVVVKMPDEDCLTTNLQQAGLSEFARVTGIARHLASQQVRVSDVVQEVSKHLESYITEETEFFKSMGIDGIKAQQLCRLRISEYTPHIAQAILKGQPAAVLQELRHKNKSKL